MDSFYMEPPQSVAIPGVANGTPDLATMTITAQQVILVAEYLHNVDGRRVTPGTISEYMSSSDHYVPPAEVEKILLSNEVISALKARGISQSDASDVPVRQVALLASMFNPMDSRTPKQIMSDLGITLAEFNGWNSNPDFKRLRNRLADELVENAAAYVDAALVKKAIRGDLRAVALYKEERRAAQESPQEIMHRVVNVVTKYIPDEATKRQVAAEIMGKRPDQLIAGEVG